MMGIKFSEFLKINYCHLKKNEMSLLSELPAFCSFLTRLLHRTDSMLGATSTGKCQMVGQEDTALSKLGVFLSQSILLSPERNGNNRMCTHCKRRFVGWLSPQHLSRPSAGPRSREMIAVSSVHEASTVPVTEDLEDSWRAAGIQSASVCSSGRRANALGKEGRAGRQHCLFLDLLYLGHLLESAAHSESWSSPSVNPHRHPQMCIFQVISFTIKISHCPVIPLMAICPSPNNRSNTCLLQCWKMQLNIALSIF